MRRITGLNSGSWMSEVLARASRLIQTNFGPVRSNLNLPDQLFQGAEEGKLRLESGSRIAVIGSGPAGSFFSYFLLDMTRRLGFDVGLDLYDPRDFSVVGPTGCNMCGGIISETLVQVLAAEGVNLPTTVVQRGIDSYMLHTDVGSVRIDTPLHEKRIAAIHRGSGPRDSEAKEMKWVSFDRFLQELAVDKGARLVRDRVDSVSWQDGLPRINSRRGLEQDYDLVAVAVGVNSASLKLFQETVPQYRAPQSTKTFICEYKLGSKTLEKYLGDSMHVFLLNLPRLEFAAIIPKGEYATVCLLGEEIDKPLIKTFLESPLVRKCFPPEVSPELPPCHCSPRINTFGAVQPFGNRLVFIGDAGVTRLFKDGIGAAYRTAKAAAETAIFAGVSFEDFRAHYWPKCREIEVDNKIGKAIFALTRQWQKRPYDMRGVMRMVAAEQADKKRVPRMSMVLWDLFTGSATYREILWRALHPGFVTRLVWNVIAGTVAPMRSKLS